MKRVRDCEIFYLKFTNIQQVKFSYVFASSLNPNFSNCNVINNESIIGLIYSIVFINS